LHAYVYLVALGFEPVKEPADTHPPVAAVPHELAGLLRQVHVRHIGADAVRAAGLAALAVQVLVGGRLPADDGTVVDAPPRVGDDLAGI
jgi:hypothetical protein